MPNPTSIKTGTLDPVRQERTWSYDPNSGIVLVQLYKGFSEARMAQLAGQFNRLGIKYEFKIAEEVSTLLTTDSSGESASDTWQLQQNELSIPVLKNPRHNTAADGTVGAYPIAAVYRAIARQWQDGKYDTVAACEDAIAKQYAADSDSTSANNVTALLARVYRGEDHYAMSSYVLRHTTNVGARSTWNVSDTNVDRIYTKERLLEECQSTSLWTNPLPTRLATKIEALYVNRPSDKDDYLWGWLKRGSTESTEANNRIGVTTEYWLDQWSQHEYANAT